uniref:BED-type domain-containing protein n=1 Tax=Meloidogyne enterolobii TaxID=390850 RepID=A0A6V7XCX8_MELEN|nr:unnamed protein product [Meloidogyne enterolobii]
MSKIWNYFTLSGRIAFCKECDYKKDFPPRAPTTTLATHLKSKHPEQHKQFLDQSTEVKEKSNKEKEKQMTLKRSFEIQSSSKEDNNEVTLKQMRNHFNCRLLLSLMPLLTKLSHRYFSAPATSSESERLFSTAGLVVSNLRTRLLPDNVEKLLFLHNNLKIYDYKYDL